MKSIHSHFFVVNLNLKHILLDQQQLPKCGIFAPKSSSFQVSSGHAQYLPIWESDFFISSLIESPRIESDLIFWLGGFQSIMKIILGQKDPPP